MIKDRNYRLLAETLERVRVRDLFLHPHRVVEDVRDLAAFATRTHHRSLEAWFLSNDTQRNRLGRDGFFDAVAGIRLARVHLPTGNGRVLPDRTALRIDFTLLPDADVDKCSRALTAVVMSFNGDHEHETEILAVGGEERS